MDGPVKVDVWPGGVGCRQLEVGVRYDPGLKSKRRLTTNGGVGYGIPRGLLRFLRFVRDQRKVFRHSS